MKWQNQNRGISPCRMHEEMPDSGKTQPNRSEIHLEAKLLREGWTLHQRLKASPHQSIEYSLSKSKVSRTKWINALGSGSVKCISKRLSWDCITPEMADWALNPPQEAIPSHPEWYSFLLEFRNAASYRFDADAYRNIGRLCCEEPFVHAWRPIAGWALETLKERCIATKIALVISQQAWMDIVEALLTRLCSITEKAMWELFNRYRSPGQALSAYIQTIESNANDCKATKYKDFIDRVKANGYFLLLDEFPVLGRLLSQATRLWLISSEEMLKRISDNRRSLERHFGIDYDAVLCSAKMGLSDPHRGGRSVAALTFNHDANTFRIAYKPKDIKIDSAYQRLLEALNKNSELEPLRCIKTIARQGYGFMEWIDHITCEHAKDLQHFYNNAGRILGILYILGCSDCHHENLVANHRDLLLVDTETLLEPELKTDSREDKADKIDLDILEASVLRTGLLPQWQTVGEGKGHTVDISALGIQPPPPTGQAQGWLCVNSDGMLYGYKEVPSTLPTSLPVSLGSTQQLTKYVDSLCDGFSQQLIEVIRLRSLLQKEISNFKGISRRIVTRSTRLYYAVQRQLLDPNALRNAVAQGINLEKLSKTFLLSSEKPLNWGVLDSEIAQLSDLDIPFFEHEVDSKFLPLPGISTQMAGLIKYSGLQSCQNRLASLNIAEIEFQQKLIRGAIAARHIHKPRTSILQPQAPIAFNRTCTNVHAQQIFYGESYKLANEIWNSAIFNKRGNPAWIGIDVDVDSQAFRFGLVGNSMFSGNLGVALLFARLAIAAHHPNGTELWLNRARSCLSQLQDLIESNSLRSSQALRSQPYGLLGLGGTILSLYLLKKAGIETANPMIDHLIDQISPHQVSLTKNADLLSGLAGLISPLLLIGSDQSLDLATVCGQRLLELQLSNGAWPTEERFRRNSKPLTGFSHGAAGIAAALAVLYKVTANSDYLRAVHNAISYEQSVFVPQRGNWPDFRGTSTSTSFMVSWCHGAAGILLSRLIINACGINYHQIHDDILFSRATTLAEIKRNANNKASHLCCGIFGLSWIMRLDSEINDIRIPRIITEVESFQIDSSQDTGRYVFLEVGDASINLPGLFTGKAGVALAMSEIATGKKWMNLILSCGMLTELL